MKNFIYKNKKYLITVLVYLIAVLTVWSIRDNFLYSHIPLIIRKMKYTHTIFDIIILSVACAGTALSYSACALPSASQAKV